MKLSWEGIRGTFGAQSIDSGGTVHVPNAGEIGQPIEPSSAFRFLPASVQQFGELLKQPVTRSVVWGMGALGFASLTGCAMSMGQVSRSANFDTPPVEWEAKKAISKLEWELNTRPLKKGAASLQLKKFGGETFVPLRPGSGKDPGSKDDADPSAYKLTQAVNDRLLGGLNIGFPIIFPLGSAYVGTGVDGDSVILPNDDPAIKNDPIRRKTPKQWRRTHFTFQPTASASAFVPWAGPYGLAGTGGSVTETAQAVIIHRDGTPDGIGKDLKGPLTLPLTSDVPMEDGTEMVVTLGGQVASWYYASLGQSLLPLLGGHVVPGVVASTEVVISEFKELRVRVKEVGNGVRVLTISDLHDKSVADTTQGFAGIQLDLFGAFGNWVIGPRGNIPDTLGAYIRNVVSLQEGESLVAAYAFDLSNDPRTGKADPEIAAAYDQAVGLFTAAADVLADDSGGIDRDGRPIGGVASVKFGKEYSDTANQFGIGFGPWAFVNTMSSNGITTGKLRPSGPLIDYKEEGAIGPFDYVQVSAGDYAGGFLRRLFKGGDEQTSNDLYFIDHPDGTTTGFMRATHYVENDGASPQEILNMAVLLRSMSDLGADGDKLLTKSWLESFRKTTRGYDFYFKQEGLMKILSTPDAEIIEVFTDKHNEGDWSGYNKDNADRSDVPWRLEDGELKDRLLKLIDAGPESNSNSNGETRNEKYHEASNGRELPRDHKALKELNNLLSFVREIRSLTDTNDEEKMQKLADMVEKLGEDNWTALATMAELAGPEGLLVDQLFIGRLNKDEGHLWVKSQGALFTPQDIANRAFNILEGM